MFEIKERTVPYSTVRYGTGTGTVLSKRRQSSRLHHIKTSATCAPPMLCSFPLVSELFEGVAVGRCNACVYLSRRLQVLGSSCLSHVYPLSRAQALIVDLALLDSYVKAAIVFCTNHFTYVALSLIFAEFLYGLRELAADLASCYR